jgi:hypothetical protein
VPAALQLAKSSVCRFLKSAAQLKLPVKRTFRLNFLHEKPLAGETEVYILNVMVVHRLNIILLSTMRQESLWTAIYKCFVPVFFSFPSTTVT